MDLINIESEETQTEAITITEAAAIAVQEMLDKKDLKDHALRVFISGGGCSGYQYGMALESEARPSDFILEQYGVKVFVDDVSMGYMKGAKVDYVDDVMGSGFKIDNPKATSTCGCGHSFQTEGSAEEGGGSCQ
ncbi:MAG: iron-sulfur cluster insertion protein ErpA [Chloroflexi bacterium]|jgi:iron-sulfur cluster assembly protein|nr:iron-sulfur cluster insertion protein ErpA [Chloroflexota bacterium]MBT3669485.1 iron-sulfur cluster insertion protein ErpA [Chloroflexota bacterium]MBT4003709.1 iron-sulfur cluster insertion protein ErpA [Chloroflexota bacterium]MBT4304496.1 iron-sulfur cluster insertion protein ErpA [Chloroflexota bacterium]MBT4534163.1 iron-sulfur cluster insertion protein ErpA [Chloroflexota bacterium]